MVVTINEIPPDTVRNQRDYIIRIYSPTRFDTIFTTVTTSFYAVYRWITQKTDILRHMHHEMRRLYPNHNRKLIVGVAVQWKPTTGNRIAATLQLCVTNHCLIYQLHHTYEMPAILQEFFNEAEIAFVCLQCPYQCSAMMNNTNLGVNFNGGNMPIDLRPHLFLLNPPRGWRVWAAPLQDIARFFLGLDCYRFFPEDDQRVCLSDWEVRHLRPAQIIYASLRAFVSFLLGVQVSGSHDGVFRVLLPNTPHGW